MQHQYQDLIQLFDSTFFDSFNTRLIKGGDEPLYLPVNADCEYHQIIFARGFYASALHEIAHWCIAGEKRRLKGDFGYWYIPDGRNEKQQQKFEQVEVCPQAVEWAFNVAANKPFNVSADNLEGVPVDRHAFQAKVYKQVLVYLSKGFPVRAQQFIEVLADFYGCQLPLNAEMFNYKEQQVEAV